MCRKPKKSVLRIEILSFQNFIKVLKTCSAGRKDFFGTLKQGARGALLYFILPRR